MYDYKVQREKLFTDEGQRLFIAYRDMAMRALDETGAFKFGCLDLPSGVGAADTWDLMACADRMVELGDVVELTGPKTMGQHRVFTRQR